MCSTSSSTNPERMRWNRSPADDSATVPPMPLTSGGRDSVCASSVSIASSICSGPEMPMSASSSFMIAGSSSTVSTVSSSTCSCASCSPGGAVATWLQPAANKAAAAKIAYSPARVLHASTIDPSKKLRESCPDPLQISYAVPQFRPVDQAVRSGPEAVLPLANHCEN